MNVLERLLREDKERERRLAPARKIFVSLRRDDQEFLLVELAKLLEATPIQTDEFKDESPALVEPDVSYVDACEGVLASNPDGLTSAEIGDLIGQDRNRADSTVRWLRQSRKNVGRRGDKWVLLKSSTKKITNRDLIKEVLKEAGRALRPAEVIAGVTAKNPSVNPNSLYAELLRLSRDLKEIERSPGNPPIGGLYTLPKEVP